MPFIRQEHHHGKTVIMKKYQKGFTLIELLVVIAVIGILASVVLASLNSARSKGRDAKRLSDMKQIQTALALYHSDNGSYPVSASSTWAGHCSSFGSLGTTGSSGYIPNLSPTYIPVLPLDPRPTGTDGCYIYRSNGTDYMFMVHVSVEGTVPSSLYRPSWTNITNGNKSYAIYTPGASSW